MSQFRCRKCNLITRSKGGQVPTMCSNCAGGYFNCDPISQEQYLDELFREVIRRMHCDICAVCGKEGSDVHHVIHRSNHNFRWWPENGVLLCREDHDHVHAGRTSLDYLGVTKGRVLDKGHVGWSLDQIEKQLTEAGRVLASPEGMHGGLFIIRRGD